MYKTEVVVSSILKVTGSKSVHLMWSLQREVDEKQVVVATWWICPCPSCVTWKNTKEISSASADVEVTMNAAESVGDVTHFLIP